MLNDSGLSYLQGSTQRSSIPEVCFYDSRLLANPRGGVIKYISRMELYSRTSDGTYIFDMRGFDWTIVSCFAELEAHDDEKHLYTPQFLQTMFFGKKLECESAPRGQFGPHTNSIVDTSCKYGKTLSFSWGTERMPIKWTLKYQRSSCDLRLHLDSAPFANAI